LYGLLNQTKKELMERVNFSRKYLDLKIQYNKNNNFKGLDKPIRFIKENSEHKYFNRKDFDYSYRINLSAIIFSIFK